MDKISYGKRIKLARKKKRFTAEMLAEKLNISSKTVWQIEGGHRGTSLDVLIKLCNVLEVSSDYLLRNDLKNEYSEPNDDFITLLPDLTKGEREMLMEFSNTMINHRKKYPIKTN